MINFLMTFKYFFLLTNLFIYLFIQFYNENIFFLCVCGVWYFANNDNLYNNNGGANDNDNGTYCFVVYCEFTIFNLKEEKNCY